MRSGFPVAIVLTGLLAVGCADERTYHDAALNLTVVRLDPELDNRWGTTGVVVQEAASGSKLHAGDLITHVVSRATVSDQAALQAALKRAMGSRRHVWQIGATETGDASAVLEIERGGQTLYIEIGVPTPRDWAKHGIRLEGNRVADIRAGFANAATKSPAEASGVLTGDEIRAVIDEDAVASPKQFRQALRRAANANELLLYTHELTGIRLEVVRTLGELGGANTQVRDRLIAIAQTSGDIAMRRTAMSALEALAAKQTDTTLLKSVLPMLDPTTEPDDELRRRASNILETLVVTLPKESLDDTVLQALVLALRDPLPGVQFKAGVMLSGLGERSVDALSVALAEGNPERVRDIAATALGDIGGAKARDILVTTLRATPFVPLQLTIATALSKIGDTPSKTELQALLQRSTDSGVQEFVRQLLASPSSAVASAP
jgi:HEAT repeat protein